MKNLLTYTTYSPIFLLACAFSLLSPATLASGIGKYESWYQDVWCESYEGQIEVKQNDGTRVDCLTKNHAIEMEFARKWHAAIGQSLHYALQTHRKAGIVLILQKPSDERYLESLEKAIQHYKLPITLWRLGP